MATQTHHLHGIRALSIAVLVLAFMLVRIHAPLTTTVQTGRVLSYATSISPQSLLDATNAARAETGHSLLKENVKLDHSAQAKAEQMVKQNYWSHNTPTGTPPWKFFEKAGYDYKKAGENLAYGFKTSDATIAAWMNSPTHRENMLDNYQDVGFGIASGSHYQGGHYTVVVAHYGTPETSPVAAAANSQSTINTAPASTVSIGSQLLSGNSSLIALVSLSLCAGAALMFALTHRRLIANAAINGEKFALRHPLFDGGLVVIVTTLILISQAGNIS